ncbi:metal ABC transporter permease [Heliorestis acidaminivorans]|uniref:Metal ABC transporter permease n=1 Tax=Heliorestis acidaminivorans TaxID=553427 RepID=A0A6I0F7K8_9FIRM|nr:metal ABC transporter permease [Heliorestis acidaminivorans]KAB2953383.1 metal ABC transporter permease [Heliorestis acidaminivorans]
MFSPQVEIMLIASVVAVACAIVGVFLVLRSMAMMSDAISHSVLLGIVLAFFLTRDLASPALIIGAAVMGLITVFLVEMLHQTRLVYEDAAIGIVFPLLFSIAVILISRHAANIHLDTDAVLLGELAFAPFDRFIYQGVDLGPKALYIMGAILMVNIFFITIFFKELKIVTFDPQLAAVLGISPVVVHYALMSLVSITAVGAFDAVGSILVVALMIAPPATAYLLTDRLHIMIGLSALLGVASALGGYAMAHYLDASIAGSMATVAGLIFAIAFLFAPGRGLLSVAKRRVEQRWNFALVTLAIHLWHREKLSPVVGNAYAIQELRQHLRWSSTYFTSVMERALKQGLIAKRDQYVQLTEEGRNLAREGQGF